MKRKFCLFPGWSTMEISPRAKLLEEEKRLLHATIASFKVARFCLLLAHTHEEAVLEDEEAKHIERMMMMRNVSRLYEWRKGLVIFRKKRETNKRKKETRDETKMTKTTPRRDKNASLLLIFGGVLVFDVVKESRSREKR